MTCLIVGDNIGKPVLIPNKLNDIEKVKERGLWSRYKIGLRDISLMVG